MTTAVSLEETIKRHIDEADAEFGVCIRHLESGEEVLVNPDSLYPLASVVKVPILVAAMAQVDEGKQSLTSRIPLHRQDKTMPSGVLVTLDDGLEPTFHDILTLMIIISDNTATDLVLKQIGLTDVEPRLAAAGVRDISVRLTIADLFRVTFETPDPTLAPAELTRAIMARGRNWDSVAGRRTFENNVASPRSMARLFDCLLGGEILSPDSTRVALDILLRQQLNDRLPRFLPPAVSFAHKTGTFLQSRNDAGIIYLPDGNHVVIVTFAYLRRDLLEADATVSRPYIDRVDSAMGRIARSVYDAFSR